MSLHVALFGNAADTMARFRGPLIAALASEGHRVSAICPPGAPEDIAAIEARGAAHVPLGALDRSGLNPLAERQALRTLTETLRRLRPDRLFAYFLKPTILAASAGPAAGVPRSVGMIEGMGFAFSEPHPNAAIRLRQSAARRVLRMLLPGALGALDEVIALNASDAELLERLGRLPEGRVRLIDGIGIDLAEYAPLPVPAGPPRFVLAARLIREKGVRDYAEAARALRAHYPQVRFTLLGRPDAAPGAIPEEEIRAWTEDGLLSWPGFTRDMPAALAQASVFVLPSRYAEGLPRSIMEAMAMGRAVVTSRAPGARHAVTDGSSGFSVDLADPAALPLTLSRFVAEPDLAARMGAAAREEAERRFDVTRANAAQMEAILA